jgi:hypothetical protein
MFKKEKVVRLRLEELLRSITAAMAGHQPSQSFLLIKSSFKKAGPAFVSRFARLLWRGWLAQP